MLWCGEEGECGEEGVEEIQPKIADFSQSEQQTVQITTTDLERKREREKEKERCMYMYISLFTSCSFPLLNVL